MPRSRTIVLCSQDRSLRFSVQIIKDVLAAIEKIMVSRGLVAPGVSVVVDKVYLSRQVSADFVVPSLAPVMRGNLISTTTLKICWANLQFQFPEIDQVPNFNLDHDQNQNRNPSGKMPIAATPPAKNPKEVLTPHPSTPAAAPTPGGPEADSKHEQLKEAVASENWNRVKKLAGQLGEIKNREISALSSQKWRQKQRGITDNVFSDQL